MVSYTESFDFLQEMYMRDLNLMFFNNQISSREALGNVLFPSVIDQGSLIKCPKEVPNSLFVTKLNLDTLFIFSSTFIRGVDPKIPLTLLDPLSVRAKSKSKRALGNALNYVAMLPLSLIESSDFIYDFYKGPASFGVSSSAYNLKINSLIVQKLSCLVSRFDFLFKMLLSDNLPVINQTRAQSVISFFENSLDSNFANIKYKFYVVCREKDRFKRLLFASYDSILIESGLSWMKSMSLLKSFVGFNMGFYKEIYSRTADDLQKLTWLPFIFTDDALNKKLINGVERPFKWVNYPELAHNNFFFNLANYKTL